MATTLQSLLDFLLPPVCLGCDGPIAPGDAARWICRRCRSRLRAPPAPLCPRCGAPRLRTGRRPGPVCGECEDWPPAIRAARSACLLHPPADRVVHRLKYEGWRALAGPMSERLAGVRLPTDAAEEAAIVVPVPTTPGRRRARGYNQAELLARAYAERTDRDVHRILGRRPGVGSQTTLQPAARAANVAGAFFVERGHERTLDRAHLLLIDDVLTTGATAAECARALVAAGARCVTVLTFVRALDARRLIGT